MGEFYVGGFNDFTYRLLFAGHAVRVCVRMFPPGQLAFARGVKRTLNEEKPFGLPGPKHNVRIHVHTEEIRKKHARENGKSIIRLLGGRSIVQVRKSFVKISLRD